LTATQTPATSPQPSPTTAWLELAPASPLAIVGTIPSGTSGGSLANVTWQSLIPTNPAFITRVDYQVTLELSVVVPAGASFTLSPYAPYNFFSQSYTVGGAQPWSLIEMVPFYLDDLRTRINYDPNYPGLGDNSGFFQAILSEGPSPAVIGGSGSLAPGQTVTNSGTSSETLTYSFTFTLPQQLTRNRTTLWGALPTGDASFIVENLLQLNALVGTKPEQNPIINATSGVTATTSGTTSVIAVYTMKSLNASVSVENGTALPTPSVGFGLQINRNSTAITNVGSWQYNPHRTGMIYLYNAELFINNQAPLAIDGFAIGTNALISSARTVYDSTVNTMQQYFLDYHRVHGRYPLTGLYEWDLERGDYPPISSLTPFRGLMTPSEEYAKIIDIVPTPAMSTFYKVPSDTTLSDAYVVNYDLGLITVGY